ncbi:hypothetical protein Dimus_007557, partial [Dionaea muscipula]
GEEQAEREAESTDTGSGEKFFDAMDEVQGPADVIVQVLEVLTPVSDQQKKKTTVGVDPSGPSGSLPDPLLQHFQEELDRARAERLQAELDNARAENVRLQALLQQATSHPKP